MEKEYAAKGKSEWPKGKGKGKYGRGKGKGRCKGKDKYGKKGVYADGGGEAAAYEGDPSAEWADERWAEEHNAGAVFYFD